MSKLTKSQLQAALNSLASAVNRAQVARSKIMEHCEAVYGVTPGDVDNDAFIDSVDGGGGSATGMSAEDFDKSMREAMKQAGFSVPA
jgi:hypothetical protein